MKLHFLGYLFSCVIAFSGLNNKVLSTANKSIKNANSVNETINPKAQWLFTNKDNLGFDFASEDGTNKYCLKSYGSVTYESGAKIGEDGSLYAATFNEDPTYKYNSTGFTLSLTFSYDTIGWTSQEGVVFQLRFSSSSDSFSMFFPKNSNELKFCSKDDNTAGYSANAKTIGTIEKSNDYNVVFTRDGMGQTNIYLNGNSIPVITTSTSSASFASNWTTFSLGSESGSTTGAHNINRFTRHANGLTFKKAEFYNQVLAGEEVSNYYQTGKVTTNVTTPDVIETTTDYDLISNSKLISRVAFISDSHFRKGLEDKNNYGDQFVYKAIDDINNLELNFDAILNLGDLSESGMDRGNISLTNWYDWVDTNPAKNPDGSTIPFYGILGNHDVRGDSNISHTSQERQEDFLKAAKLYQEREIYSDWQESKYIKGTYSNNQESPDLNYYTKIGGYHYVFLNTCESQWDACNLTRENLKWLDDTLTKLEKEDGNNPIFILVHQPIDMLNNSVYVLDEDGKKSSNIYEFHEVLSKHKTTICCTGHTHRPLGVNHRFQDVEFNGIKVPNFINMPSLEYNNYADYAPVGVEGYKIKDKADYSNVQYYVCEIYENGVIFKGRDGQNKKWIEESFMGVHKKCDISFKVNGTVIETKEVRLGDKISTPEVEAYSDDNYTYYLKKWLGLNDVCKENATYEAEFLKIVKGSETYSNVTYETNGHGKDNFTNKILNGLYATNIELYEQGYTFSGWYKNKELTIPYDFYNDEITNDITLYAKWDVIPVAYTVEHYQEKLDSTGYDLVKKETLYGAQGELTNAQAMNYEGFTNTKINQKKIDESENVVIKIFYYRNTYTITFKNGDNVISTKEYLYGEEIETPNDIPTKEETKEATYTFNGWDKEITTAKENVVYNAVFDSNLKMYSINIINNEKYGTYTKLDTTEYAYGTKLTINFSPKENYNIDYITLNGEKVDISNNSITLTIDDNINLEVNYKEVTNTKKGCSGSIGSCTITLLTIFLGIIYLKKRKIA